MLHRVIAWGFALALAACSSLPMNAQAPKVSVADVDVKRLGLLEQRFDVSLRVNNPNEFDLKIEGVEFDLTANGRPFAKGLSHLITSIPAISSSIIHVEAITQSKDLLRQIRTLPPESLQEGVPYEIKGRVKLDRTDWLPFEHKGVYGGDEKKPAKGTT